MPDELSAFPFSRQDAERWLSVARLRPYLEACDGDIEKALSLYEWNLDLGLVLLRELSLFEIALRNAYDRLLSDMWCPGGDWLLDPDSPVNRPIARRIRSGGSIDANALNREQISKARRRFRGRECSHDDLVAELSLGFWAHLTDRAHERDLWIPILHKAWALRSKRVEIDRLLRSVTECRNRIAHHERLFNPKRRELLPLEVERFVAALQSSLSSGISLGSFGGMTIEEFVRMRPRNVNVGQGVASDVSDARGDF